MAKAPSYRGFTVAEARSLIFERVTLITVLLVSIIAAIASFFALAWCGRQFMGPAGYLLPIAVDGFALSCSVSIVRSQSDGERGKERINEWLGLWLALLLSIAGNIAHALDQGTGVLYEPLTVAFAAAIPVIVAYGIHVYCRAMSRGVSARVMVDDPTRIRDDAYGAPIAARPARADRPAPAREPARAAARVPVDAPTVTAPAVDPVERPAYVPRPARTADWEMPLRAAFDDALAANPGRKPDARQLQMIAGLEEMHPATPRKRVAQWWAETQTDTPETPPAAVDPAPAEPAPSLERETADAAA